MKKLVGIFIFIIIILFMGIFVMVSIDNRYFNKLEDKIRDNVKIKDIVYVNEYDNNYIVMDNEYLYLFDSEYDEIYKIEVDNIHKNKFDYDIVYRDSTIMYMDSSKNKDGVKFRYYDIYTYELIDEVLVGGK